MQDFYTLKDYEKKMKNYQVKRYCSVTERIFKNNIGALPVRYGTNAVDMNKMYKELRNHTNKI